MKQLRTKQASDRIRHKLSLSITIFILFISVIITTVSGWIYSTYLRESVIQNTKNNLQFFTASIEKKFSNVCSLIQFCQVNTTLGDYTEANLPLDNTYVMNAFQRLNDEYNSNDSNNYIHRVILAGNNGHFLQIVPTTHSSSVSVMEIASQLPYFSELLQNTGYCFSTGFVTDPFYSGSRTDYVLPLIRPIHSKFYDDATGWIMVLVSPELFTDQLSAYTLPKDSTLYLQIEDHVYKMTTGGLEPCSAEVLNTSRLISTPIDEMPGCYMHQTASTREFRTMLFAYVSVLLVVVLLIIACGILTYKFLHRTITIPVTKLGNRLALISDGNFSRDPEIEWEHELGDIGRGINDMSEKIKQLLSDAVKEEHAKQDLEYKMLQSQINPHFLYNTLNSIKWMATMQGADGISEMTTALSRLLKSISKGTKIVHSLREELTLLEDYLTIQKYRYGGTIQTNLHIEDDALLDVRIVKFTLQPLVENAIFHGIEPKGTTGEISVSVTNHSDTSIRIEILDNGVGMTQEQLQSLLEDSDDRSSDFFRGFGLRNVHKRLCYEFGADYGISMESEINCFTKVKILLPKTYESENTDV